MGLFSRKRRRDTYRQIAAANAVQAEVDSNRLPPPPPSITADLKTYGEVITESEAEQRRKAEEARQQEQLKAAEIDLQNQAAAKQAQLDQQAAQLRAELEQERQRIQAQLATVQDQEQRIEAERRLAEIEARANEELRAQQALQPAQLVASSPPPPPAPAEPVSRGWIAAGAAVLVGLFLVLRRKK